MHKMTGIHSVLTAARYVQDQLASSMRVYQKYGPLVAINPKIIHCVGPELAKEVMLNYKMFLGGGIMIKGPEDTAYGRLRKVYFAANHDEYDHYQKQFRPYFKKPVVNSTLNDIARVCTEEIAKWPKGQKKDFFPFVTDLATRVAFVSFFKEEHNPIAQHAANEVQKLVKLGGLSWRNASPKPYPGSQYNQMLAQGEKTEQALLAWADTRKNMCPEHDIMASIIHRDDEHGCPASDGRIAAYTLNLFGASYETTVSAVSWSCVLLAQYPKMAQRIRDEIEKIGWHEGDDPQLLIDLPLLDWFSHEALRLFPPGPMQRRKAWKDTELAGNPIRGGATVLVSAWQTNRLEELYPEPSKFDPDRWDGNSHTPYEWLSFSAGPRRCTGIWFGKAYLKLIVAYMVLHGDFVADKGTKIDLALRITLKPKNGLPLTMVDPGTADPNPAKIGGSFGKYVK
jgi:cytochrome P450